MPDGPDDTNDAAANDVRAGPGADRSISRIFIAPDGEVVIENLTPELLDVALALDDGDRRLRAIAAATRGHASDAASDESPI